MSDTRRPRRNVCRKAQGDRRKRRNARPTTRLTTRSAMRSGTADADVSVSMPQPSAGASNCTCGARLASCTRPPGCPDPSGARSRKMSGWIVPKTEIPGPANPGSAGPACVPADLSTNPKHIAAIPNGIARTPDRTNRSPTPTHAALGATSNGSARPPTRAQESLRLRQEWFGPVRSAGFGDAHGPIAGVGREPIVAATKPFFEGGERE